MTLQLLEILKSKLALRRRLTVLPIAEKLRLLDELRERSQTIGISRAQSLGPASGKLVETRHANSKIAASSGRGRVEIVSSLERSSAMNAVRAIWTNGCILPSEPVDWPEGSQLRVQPLSPPGEKIGLSEDEWQDDPDSIAAWIEAVEKIEPLIWEEGEEEEFERWREKCREFNIEAVRQQMEAMSEGDAP